MTTAEEEVPRYQNLKSARIIVRNLPFSSTEDEVKKHFSTYGELSEVNILKKSNGKLVGCCFIQFLKKSDAAKAISQSSGIPFKGRVVIADWAIPKDKFLKGKQAIKPKLEDEVKEEIKEEIKEEEEKAAVKVASSSEDTDHEIKKRKIKIENDEDEQPVKKLRYNDENTIFIKNLPFTSTNNELRKSCENIGHVNYALICMDKMTEHSKGTGFVQFKHKEDYEDVLEGRKKIVLGPVPLQVCKAVKKGELQPKTNQGKDKRNLYLSKEGVIVAGTSAAEGVSPSDMAKRLQLERWKSKSLKNLHIFVSPVRLVIHNLPPFYDDKRLRELCVKYSPKNARVKETKVMKESKTSNISKCYGFVSFDKHEHSLAWLRKVNNNPEIFLPHKRPIVAFSLENKKALLVKEKRKLNAKSKQKTQQETKQGKETAKAAFAGQTAQVGNRKNITKKKQFALQNEIKKKTNKRKFSKKLSRKEKRKNKSKEIT